MLEITRKGLKISAINKLEPAQGSYNVPVALKSDGTYQDYKTNMYIGWYERDVLKNRKAEVDSSGNYLIPKEAFQQTGMIYISFLLEKTDKTQGLMTNELGYQVKNAPNVIIEVPADPSWEELVKEWTKELVGEVNVDPSLKKAGYAADAKATGDAIDELFDEIVEHWVKCSEVGMTTDDTNGNNFDLLCEAISNSDTVIVDDMYMLNPGGTYDINKNVNIVGTGNNCGFTFKNAGTLFNICDDCKEIRMENLSIINSVDQLLIMFYKTNHSTRMKLIYMNNCNVSGRVSPFRIYQNTSINPSETEVGVDIIKIENNVFKDSKASCFVLTDVSYNLLEIENNVIRNFDNIFVSSGVTNGVAFEKNLIDSKKSIIVSNNDVRCDDECFRDETSTTAYYAFILAEGLNALYKNNHVEGMKSNVDIPLYDAYLSCVDVVYENNFWKNNCVFVNTYNNTLMKAKENGGSDSGHRRYHNNVFIAEKSFYEKHNSLNNNCVIRIVDNVRANSYEIENNYIDVYCLGGFLSSSKMDNFTFKNNVVKTNKWVDGYLLAGTNESVVICQGNSITCETGNFGGLVTGNFIADQFICCNNTFDNCRYPLGYGNAKKLIMSDNTFLYDLSVDGMLSSYGNYESVVGHNNKIVMKKGHLNLFGGGFSENVDYEIDSTLESVFSSRHIIKLNDIGFSNLIIDFEGVTLETYQPFKGNVIISVVNGSIRYTNNEGETIVETLNSGNTITPKVNMVTGDSLPFNVFINLNGDNKTIILSKSNTDKLVMKTRIYSTTASYFYTPTDANLPVEYQQVFYVETDGNQYIDTNVLASNYSDGINYSFKGVLYNLTTSYLFGCLYDSKRSCNVTIGPEVGLGMALGGTNIYPFDYSNVPLNSDITFDILNATALDPTGLTATLNGKPFRVTGNTGITASDMPNATIWFLKCNGSTRTGPTCRVYEFTMEKSDGTPIRNFVPCYRVADGTIGLYDTVNGVFYTNAGTGTFVKGTDV